MGTAKPIKLSDFRGKTVVIYFYPKDDTPGCTAQACALRDRYEHLLETGAMVFGVSVDSPESHAKFIAKHSLPFPLISDERQEIVQAYGVWIEKRRKAGPTWERSAALSSFGRTAASSRSSAASNPRNTPKLSSRISVTLNRDNLLSLYERLTKLVEKLPGGLQKPVLRELVPIRELFLEQRPARIVLLGGSGKSVPEFLRFVAGVSVETGESDNGWRILPRAGPRRDSDS